MVFQRVEQILRSNSELSSFLSVILHNSHDSECCERCKAQLADESSQPGGLELLALSGYPLRDHEYLGRDKLSYVA